MSKIVSIYLDEDTLKKLDEMANNEKRSRSNYITMLVHEKSKKESSNK